MISTRKYNKKIIIGILFFVILAFFAWKLFPSQSNGSVHEYKSKKGWGMSYSSPNITFFDQLASDETEQASITDSQCTSSMFIREKEPNPQKLTLPKYQEYLKEQHKDEKGLDTLKIKPITINGYEAWNVEINFADDSARKDLPHGRYLINAGGKVFDIQYIHSPIDFKNTHIVPETVCASNIKQMQKLIETFVLG